MPLAWINFDFLQLRDTLAEEREGIRGRLNGSRRVAYRRLAAAKADELAAHGIRHDSV
jgi:hypothetical protein